MEIPQAGDALAQLIFNITYLGIGAGLVAGLTAILKHYIAWDAGRIALVLQVILWVVYSILRQYFGIGAAEIKNVLDIITQIVTVAGGFFLTTQGASVIYSSAVARGTPLIGYQRSPPAL